MSRSSSWNYAIRVESDFEVVHRAADGETAVAIAAAGPLTKRLRRAAGVIAKSTAPP
ncbi:MAG: hypothetical protein JJE52_01555 [Acidimicrobiia bacterium]|nr:hypothetical protein [Acidimicrobiia bacterium]